MAQKPSIPKGTRDFTPAEVVKRNYIFDIIKKNFQTYGFQPIETPSFENSETLMGKYGDEGDRLIFKILNSGDYLSKIDFSFFQEYAQVEMILKSIYKEIKLEGQKGKLAIPIDDLKENLVSTYSDRLMNFSTRRLYFIDRLFMLYKESNFGENSDFEQYGFYPILKEAFQSFLNLKSTEVSRFISEKALRYDLTVPFARYVVMHQNEIDFPFKRYQIQPVWRADRPQKGRFREFFQCDADVVGSDSLLQEVELVQLYDAVFADLKLEGVNIKLNNRKILAGIAEVIGAKDNLIDFTVALDKLDKIGEEGVKKEMLDKGISQIAIDKAEPLFSLAGTNLEKLSALENLLANSEEGSKGVNELHFIIKTIAELELQTARLSIDVTLARGLNYYTGAIFEVAAPEKVQMGSIGGGGRYDDLTGIFGLKDVSGVGISFGLDRIYLVLEELGLFPEAIEQSLQVLCVNFGEKEALAALKLTTQLRKNGIKADVYPSSAKMQKQMKYANNRNVPYVILIGEQELAENSFVVKDMIKGSQQTYSSHQVSDFINSL